MKNTHIYALSIVCLTAFMSCSQDTVMEEEKAASLEKMEAEKPVPHNYGGYFCPDNLGGFPAVDIANWESVPVVNGRMATREETQNGTSLIFVDDVKYPNAKPLDMTMPKLARYYNRPSGKNELVIVVQAINVSNDSIVGFRFLNGGNGSARLNEVSFLSDKEIENISPSRFVTLTLKINATENEIWKVLTKAEYCKALQATFDKENKLKADWNAGSEVNFKYADAGKYTSEFAGDVWGNQYIQIDFESGNYQYVEKFLLLEDDVSKSTELQIVSGPYGYDFESQKIILNNWAQKVKELSKKK